MKGRTATVALMLAIAALILSLSPCAAGIKIWYPLGFKNVDSGGHRPFVVATEHYKFVYDLGRPGITELYNVAGNPSAPNLLQTSSNPGGYISVLDSTGKGYSSYLSDGNRLVSVTKGSNTFNNVHGTRMSFRQAGRVYYQIDVTGIKLVSSDGSTAPVTVRQRFHLWPEKFYIETSFDVSSNFTVRFAEQVFRYEPSRFSHNCSGNLGTTPLSPGSNYYLAAADPYFGLIDAAGTNGSLAQLFVNRSETDSVVMAYGPYWGAATALNIIHRAVDSDIRGTTATWRAGETHTIYSQFFFSGKPNSSELVADAAVETNPITLTKLTSSSGVPSSIPYDNTCGSYRLEMPCDFPDSAFYNIYADIFPNYYETARVRIANNATPRQVRLKVVRGSSLAGSSPWAEILVTDASGFPLAAPTEQNSDWGAPTLDRFFACYTSLPVATGETKDVNLNLIYQNWGKKPIIRMQCQDLYTWDGSADEQQWMQSSIGQGENMVYHIQRVWCTVEDARGLNSRTLGASTTWRDNCGGWEFLKFDGGKRPESRGLIYHKSGPNLFDFTLTGEMDDGSMTSSVRTYAIPANEVTRTFFHIRYDVKSTINISNIAANLRLFALGDEHYGSIYYPYVAYTDAAGNVVNQSAGSSFTKRAIGGPSPWACTYGASKPLGQGGNRGFVLRSYSARINGNSNNSPAITLQAGSQTRLILTANTSETRMIAGDYFEFDLETIAYGVTNSGYAAMQAEAAAFGGGKPSVVTANHGTKVSDFPAKINIGSDGYADFTITGGRDIIPVEIGGFTSHTTPTASDLQIEELIGSTWTPVDISTGRRDWWQTEFDETTGKYSFVFSLLTDGSTRRLRVFHLLNKTESELYSGKTANLTVYPFPAHIGGSYLAGTGDSPVMAGDWFWHTMRNTSASSSRYTPMIRYSAVTDSVVHLEVNGVNQTGPVTLTATGANVWKTVPASDVVLNSGFNNVKLVSDTGGVYLDWVEYRLERPAQRAVDDAALFSDDVPVNISSNVPNVCSITMRNTGTSTWTATGGYGLWSDNEFSTAVLHPVTADVPPGATHTFTFTCPAPTAEVKLYTTRWQMRHGTQAFGTPVVRAQRSTDQVLTYESACLLSDNIPIRMSAGETRTIEVRVRNTGTSTWNGTDVTDAHGLVRADGIFGPSGGGRFILSNYRVAPGQDYTFSFSITAPAQPGIHMLRLRMKHRPSTMFGPYFLREIEVVSDATPPSAPVVTDGTYSTSTNSLSASWLAADTESGIISYQYAIGTSPVHTGSNYILGWTDKGTSRTVTAGNLSLNVGTRYYFYVRCRNGAGMWSTVGVSDGVTVVRGTSNVADAKSIPPGTMFMLSGVWVTSSSAQQLFIEQPDMSAGMRLLWAGAPFDTTRMATVVASYKGYIDNEPTADLLSIEAGVSASPKPVAMASSSLGWNSSSGSAHIGPDTRCLLIRTWGRITYAGSGFFLIDDGTRATDFEQMYGCKGIRVALPAGSSAPPVGKYAVVTGICRAAADGTRWVMPRSTNDIAYY